MPVWYIATRFQAAEIAPRRSLLRVFVLLLEPRQYWVEVISNPELVEFGILKLLCST